MPSRSCNLDAMPDVALPVPHSNDRIVLLDFMSGPHLEGNLYRVAADGSELWRLLHLMVQGTPGHKPASKVTNSLPTHGPATSYASILRQGLSENAHSRSSARSADLISATNEPMFDRN
jgi:hypothetical protein